MTDNKLIYHDEKENIIIKVKDKKLYKYNKKLIKTFTKKANNELYTNIFSNQMSWKLVKLLTRKIINKKKYVHRLAKELQLIDYFNFTEVFLQVCEILHLAGDIPHIIRG